MYKEALDRQIKLIGEEKTDILQSKTVAVFGLGGVGSFALEALARAGVGKIIVCDGDVVDVTNINRQLYALHSTVGVPKTVLAKARILDINPDAQVEEYNLFFSKETLHQFDFSGVDYIVDCIDTVTSKILLVEAAKSAYKPIIACLGTGNKLDPTAFKVADIYQTRMCPLAKVLRKELKDRGIDSLKVVYSEEQPLTPIAQDKRTPASISFVPPVAGFILAGQVIKDLIG